MKISQQVKSLRRMHIVLTHQSRGGHFTVRNYCLYAFCSSGISLYRFFCLVFCVQLIFSYLFVFCTTYWNEKKSLDWYMKFQIFFISLHSVVSLRYQGLIWCLSLALISPLKTIKYGVQDAQLGERADLGGMS